jgi:hypothetical protein
MPSNSTVFSKLASEIEILPELVSKTLRSLPESRRQNFDKAAKSVLGDGLADIKNNVTDLADWKLTQAQKRTQSRARNGETARTESVHLIHLLNTIDQHLKPDTAQKLETRVASIVKNCVASLRKRVTDLQGTADIIDDWRDLHRKIEVQLRRLEILNSPNEQAYIASLWWISQQGTDSELDMLFKTREDPPYTSPEAISALAAAPLGIIKREEKDLLDFFYFSPEEVLRVIESTLKKSRAVSSPFLKKVSVATRPSQVISLLRKIRHILRSAFESERISCWLSAPLEVFDAKSPRDALLEGKTFQVLHLLERMDDNPHY